MAPVTQLFVPRVMQQQMIGFGTRRDRFQLLAKPGTGKTVSMLMILDIMSRVDDVFPALIVAPLRVANSVWDSEITKWVQFNGLRVSKILGTAPQRLAALNVPADIYTIHYGLLQWLRSTLGDKWPFRTVVCDESTRIAAHRCTYQRHRTSGKIFFREAGAVNAAALMSYARRTPYWANLTGSFTTNGLSRAWGQTYPIDFGRALGGSYSAFTDRWFRARPGTSREQEVLEPLPWALDAVTEAVKPFSISIDPKNYFDIRELRIVDIPVTLPPAAMRQYRQLRDKSLLELSNEKVITAANAGPRIVKLMSVSCGHVYDEDGRPWHLHDAKLDALDELVNRLNGSPILVCYQFRPDRDAILKRFPFARTLPSREADQKKTEDEWNSGQIPMLVVHPASCGHGLSLQHGGCDIVFYSTAINPELYEQVIERLGPMRQMQSGYDRVVSVYRLLSTGTHDALAVDLIEGRITFGNELMTLLKTDV
ncbi:dead-like helicase protein [Lasius niger]|uniref:Dead-like helicase protein n=1 Tax=Lasius niger TaxID=67767 RepID=A0A0J7L4C7_LASNI|nr:dead-like helicase protein [Lasius niger]